MHKIIVITGASSGFGAMTARALARAGHTVYAGMRDTAGRNAPAVADAAAFAAEQTRVDLRTVELDVADQDSVDAAIDRVVAEAGRLDVVVHNAGHMVLGPTEAFTPEQLASVYDTNVLVDAARSTAPRCRTCARRATGCCCGSASRAPAAAPRPTSRRTSRPRRRWTRSPSATPPSWSASASTRRSSCPARSPAGPTTSRTRAPRRRGAAAYEERYAGLLDQVRAGSPRWCPGADPPRWRDRRVVDLPRAERPFRVHVDPADDGSEVVTAVADRVRAEFFRRVGIEDLLAAGASR